MKLIILGLTLDCKGHVTASCETLLPETSILMTRCKIMLVGGGYIGWKEGTQGERRVRGG